MPHPNEELAADTLERAENALKHLAEARDSIRSVNKIIQYYVPTWNDEFSNGMQREVEAWLDRWIGHVDKRIGDYLDTEVTP